MVHIAAYDNAFGTEIRSGGSMLYGYNWNAKSVPTGNCRLTFVLDGNDGQGLKCSTPLLTRFASGTTQMVNQGESNPSHPVHAGDAKLGDEGGQADVHLTLTTKGGGSRK